MEFVAYSIPTGIFLSRLCRDMLATMKRGSSYVDCRYVRPFMLLLSLLIGFRVDRVRTTSLAILPACGCLDGNGNGNDNGKNIYIYT